MDLAQPTRTIRKNIPAEEVAKYYLKSEYGRIFPDESLRTKIDKTIDFLEGKELWRLLEAASSTYRLNSVFWQVSNFSNIWNEEEWPAEKIFIPSISPRLIAIMESSSVANNPIKFRDYLNAYFQKNLKSDLADLDQFRPTTPKITYKKIILAQKGDKVVLIDGTHRLMALLLNGETRIQAYRCQVGTSEGKEMVGDSVFRLLRKLYLLTDDPKGKNAILAVVKLLAKNSSDGQSSIQTYWIDHVFDDFLKAVGKKLLNQDAA